MLNKKNGALFSKLIFGVATSNLFFLHVAHAVQINNLRNQRYCEVILSPSLKSICKVNVYNTIGLNNCPSDLWNKMTVASVKKETGSRFVHLNGPRYWIIDGMTGSTRLVDKSPRQFGGIAMREAATVNLSWSDILFGAKPYNIHIINRNTTYVFRAHQAIYELINPQGERFVMQSYSAQKVVQTESSLNQLATKLTLPRGWHFETHILAKERYLSTINNKAILIQDNLLNSYQKENANFTN